MGAHVVERGLQLLVVVAVPAVVGCGDTTAEPADGLAPAITAIADQATESGVPVEVALTVGGDPVTALTAGAANEVLLPESGIAVSGSGAAFTLTMTPSPGLSGSTVVTVTATNAAGSGEASFELDVARSAQTAGTFAWTQRLAPPASDTVDRFGCDVAVSDDLIAVVTQDLGDLDATYVYRSADLVGPWQETIRLPEENAFDPRVALGTYTLATSRGTATTIYGRTGLRAGSWPVTGQLTTEARDLDGERLIATALLGETAELRRLEGGVWLLEDELDPGDLDENSGFAEAAALSGDLAVVGAPWDGETGAVHVFRRNGAVWSLEQRLTPDDGRLEDGFGTSVAVSGDLIAVGAPAADPSGERSGAVYLFERDETWAPVAKFVGQNTHDELGTALDAHGGEVVAGAPGADLAYHYVRSGAMWTARPLSVPGASAGDRVGASVAFDVDVIVLGAPSDRQRPRGTGAAHVFVR